MSDWVDGQVCRDDAQIILEAIETLVVTMRGRRVGAEGHARIVRRLTGVIGKELEWIKDPTDNGYANDKGDD